MTDEQMTKLREIVAEIREAERAKMPFDQRVLLAIQQFINDRSSFGRDDIRFARLHFTGKLYLQVGVPGATLGMSLTDDSLVIDRKVGRKRAVILGTFLLGDPRLFDQIAEILAPYGAEFGELTDASTVVTAATED